MAGLHVRVLLSGAPDAGTYQVVVALRDTSREDAEHPTVATARVEVAAGAAAEVYLPVRVELDPRNRYTLWAHAAAGETERISPGDYLTTAVVPVTAPEVRQEREIELTLRRI
jgi:hypothetical protein